MPVSAFWKKHHLLLIRIAGIISVALFLSASLWYILTTNATILMLQKVLAQTNTKLFSAQKEANDLKHQDQYVINQKLQKEIEHIHTTYLHVAKLYEALLSFKAKAKNTSELDKLFALSLSLLAEKNYVSSEATLKTLEDTIQQEEKKISQDFTIPQNVPQNNTPPGSGFSKQQVSVGGSSFLVALVAGDLASTKVIVDTASDGDCRDNCPTLPLADYVSRNGAFAGINGSFFCPAEYPSCAGKTNSFDLLVMNKNKHYLNSDNNVYSSNPTVIFGNGFVRFVAQGQEWGRDTGVDGVLMNYPSLVQGKQVTYGGSSDSKFESRGARNFVAHKANTVYIGTIFNATMADSAKVLQALGMDDAINLDEGGSTALWYGGYQAGPGRNIPNAILFLRK